MTNVANKPTTISEEQATAIEANTAKRSYPETDENKLAGIEEGATVGADWQNNVQNKPAVVDLLAQAFSDAGVTDIEFEQTKKHLKLIFTIEGEGEVEKKIELK